VIDACDLGDVVDVINQGLERRARKFGGPFPLDLVFVEIGDRFPRRFQFCEVRCDRRVGFLLLGSARDDKNS
jgi:hypothetical protein